MSYESRNEKKLVLVVFLLMFMCVSQSVSAEEVIADGSVKESYGAIMWSIDKNGHLRVSVTGDISDKKSEDRAPWYKYRSVITSTEISVSGMTDASYLFNGCENNLSLGGNKSYCAHPARLQVLLGDVYEDWYTGYVQYVYDNNLMTGIKGITQFVPNANITKAKMAALLQRFCENVK